MSVSTFVGTNFFVPYIVRVVTTSPTDFDRSRRASVAKGVEQGLLALAGTLMC